MQGWLELCMVMEEKGGRLGPARLAEAASPWLVYTHRNDEAKKIQTFCNLSKSHIKSIPQLRGKTIVASFDDWLLLCDFDKEAIFSLWNFFTLQLISLPEFIPLGEEEMGITACALVKPTNSGLGLVLLFCDALVFFCRITEDSAAACWAHQSIELDGVPTVTCVNDVATCNGILYCRAQTKKGRFLITIEFAERDSNSLLFKSLGIKDPSFGLCCHSPEFYLFLVESCGELYSFAIVLRIADSIQQIIKVRVWRLDLSLMRWVPVYHLGNRAFFLGVDSCTWCWASPLPESSDVGFEANCVYFAPEDDSTLYSYRLEDDSFIFLLPCPSLHTPFHGHVWVMPQHLRIQKEFGAKMLDKGQNLCQDNMVIEHRRQEQNDMRQKSLTNLPPDVITLISKHLHLFDYLNFRISCKAFCSVIPQAQWRANTSLPLFMHSKDGKGLCELRDPCRHDSLSIMIPHSPAVPAEVEFSKDGWLVVCTNENCTNGESLQFFNPFTRVKGEFPPSVLMHSFASLGFSTCPTSSDCLTVGILDCIDRVMILCLKSGHETWECHELEFDREDIKFEPGHCSPVYYKEAFYFLDQYGHLGAFRLVQGSSNWKSYVKPKLLNDLHSSHLVECDGELLSVFIGEVGSWIQVFKFNHLEENWDELQSLGNHMLFIGPRSSFSVTAKEHGMENRIYLPLRKGDDIVFYSLETGKYHTNGGEDATGDFCGMIGQSLCCWV